MRLDKFTAYTLNLTRSQAKDLIKKGEIEVNGEIVRKGDHQLDLENDRVTFRGEVLEYEEKVYLLLNKPAGYVSSHKDELCPSVFNLLPGFEKYNLFIAGRLDADSEGLLLATNDGDLAHRITSPNHRLPKKYYVRVEGKFKDSDVFLFREGMNIKDGDGNVFKTLPADLEIISENEAFVTVFEGKFHQVKRMCRAAGKEVVRLIRTEIGPLKLDESLRPGAFRKLSHDEVEILKKECT